jgi:putative phosphotransacetylase
MAMSVSRSQVEAIVREAMTSRKSATCATCTNCSRLISSPLVVNVSARHLHLSPEDLEKLFGPGHQLTPMRPLYQDGHFAAAETVTLIGPRSRLISNLRILGPCRRQSQIELAFTDAISLGIDVPLRLSGDIAGSPGGVVMGPAGVVELKEGIIRAAMHVHMNPADAEFYGVKHRDVMKLRVGGAAGVTFTGVHARVDPTYKLEVHMDTDEANACGLRFTKDVQLFA